MDIFSTGTLIAAINTIVPEYGFLTRMYFPGEQIQQTEEVFVDVRRKSKRISPFVSPYVQGQLVEKQGFKTFSLKPAYIKDKRVFDPNVPFTRTFGEPLMGNLSPAQRMERSVGIELADQQDMLNRRLEVMAGEVLATGKLTIVGDLYPEVQLDFNRDPALTVHLSGSGEWGDSGVDPLALLETWAELVFSKSSVRPRKVTMTLDAYKLFRASAAVQKLFDRFRDVTGVTLKDAPAEGDDGWYAGNIGNLDIYVYAGTYIDPIDNTEKSVLPPYTVILGGQQMQGYKAFGAIRDEKAGLQAMRAFPKSWVTDDPAVRYLMLQSAPILAPLYPDAVLAATVKQ